MDHLDRRTCQDASLPRLAMTPLAMTPKVTPTMQKCRDYLSEKGWEDVFKTVKKLSSENFISLEEMSDFLLKNPLGDRR